jgi:hypothetical protein
LRTELAALLFVLVGFAAASLPFFVPRWGFVFVRPGAKPFLMYAFESLVLFALVVIAFLVWEARSGTRAPQDWEFYTVIVCLWLVAAFPGFVWRFLLRGKAARAVADVHEDAA